MDIRTWTDNLLREAVESSYSMAAVLRTLELHVNGSSSRVLKKHSVLFAFYQSLLFLQLYFE